MSQSFIYSSFALLASSSASLYDSYNPHLNLNDLSKMVYHSTEKGEEIGILTFIKLLQGVELERNLENVIPDYTRRPSYYANNGNLPKRAVRKKQADSEWKWGDEQ